MFTRGQEINAYADGNNIFITQGIAEYTLADVAASANLSGPTHLGGDNILEFSTGNITTSVIDVGSLNEVLWSSIADDIKDSTLENLLIFNQIAAYCSCFVLAGGVVND